jgi:hypothetical protein
VDLRESSQSYVFGLSTITVCRIRKISSLHYFTKGDVWVLGDEVIPDPMDDEVVLFEEFLLQPGFACSLSLPLWTFCTSFMCISTS